MRTSGDPEQMAVFLRQALKDLDLNVPVYNQRALEAQINDTLVGQRLPASLTTCFGAIALLLASSGVYRVLSYRAACRTREIGLAIALGARSSDVVESILRQVLLLTVLGAAIGTAAVLKRCCSESRRRIGLRLRWPAVASRPRRWRLAPFPRCAPPA